MRREYLESKARLQAAAVELIDQMLRSKTSALATKDGAFRAELVEMIGAASGTRSFELLMNGAPLFSR